MALLETTTSNLSRRERQLRKEISEMRHQLASLSRTVGDVGHGVYVDATADARDLFRGVQRRAKKARRRNRHHEADIAALAKAYPFTVVSAVAGVGLLAAAVIAWSIERDS